MRVEAVTFETKYATRTTVCRIGGFFLRLAGGGQGWCDPDHKIRLIANNSGVWLF